MYKKILVLSLMIITFLSSYGQNVKVIVPKKFKVSVDTVELENLLKMQNKFKFNEYSLRVLFTKNSNEYIGIRLDKKKLLCTEFRFKIDNKNVIVTEDPAHLKKEDFELYKPSFSESKSNFNYTTFLQKGSDINNYKVSKTESKNELMCDDKCYLCCQLSEGDTYTEFLKAKNYYITYPSILIGPPVYCNDFASICDSWDVVLAVEGAHGSATYPYIYFEDGPFSTDWLSGKDLYGKVLFYVSCLQYRAEWINVVFANNNNVGAFIASPDTLCIYGGAIPFRLWCQNYFEDGMTISGALAAANYYVQYPWYSCYSTINYFSIGHNDQNYKEQIKADNEKKTITGLIGNYPNPFNPSTAIKYSIAENTFVKLIIYNPNGQEVETLVNRQHSPGTYTINWQPKNVPSGVYYYSMQTGKYNEVRKMNYVK